MKKKTCRSYEELEDYLTVHVKERSAPIAIIGGHYALNAEGEAAVNPDDKGSFGIFPRFTLDLAARLTQKGRKLGSRTKLVLVVDDHSQMPHKQWYQQGINPKLDISPYFMQLEREKIRKVVQDYFKEFSLPKEYLQILANYGLTKSDFIHSEEGLPFQETRYREQFYRETGLNPGCAGEYRLILEELAEKGIRKVIAFLPSRCQEPTCTAVSYYFADKKNPPLVNVNVYLSSNEANETPEQLLEEMVEATGGIVVMREG